MSSDLKIAVSGKSGCGNSTVSRIVAATLGLRLVNYTFHNMAEERGIEFESFKKLVDDRAEKGFNVGQLFFAANGWGGSWRNGIYSFHHYHSTAHEVLAVAHGRARVQFGGESGPKIDVQQGDVVVIPAGVAHKNLGASTNLLVVGAYPEGQPWDMNHGRPGERPRTDENIRRVPRPEADPVNGGTGPLIEWWSAG